MKTQKGKLILLFTMFLSLITANVFSKPMHNETVNFKVFGNCEMCKKRIETALKKNPAIKSAEWNVKTKMVKVVYDPHLISVDDIHKIVADAGHNTDKVKAKETAYKKLPGCCQYDRKK